MEVEAFLKEKKVGIFMHMEELWLRRYQVLPGRTHPEMQNDLASGGYVLHGYKIGELFSDSK